MISSFVEMSKNRPQHFKFIGFETQITPEAPQRRRQMAERWLARSVQTPGSLTNEILMNFNFDSFRASDNSFVCFVPR